MVSYRNLSKNPFAQYSAEEDLEHLKSIYFEPRYYRELRDNARNGSSRILVGQRGLGKSATIHFLFEDLINKYIQKGSFILHKPIDMFRSVFLSVLFRPGDKQQR